MTNAPEDAPGSSEPVEAANAAPATPTEAHATSDTPADAPAAPETPVTAETPVAAVTPVTAEAASEPPAAEPGPPAEPTAEAAAEPTEPSEEAGTIVEPTAGPGTPEPAAEPTEEAGTYVEPTAGPGTPEPAAESEARAEPSAEPTTASEPQAAMAAAGTPAEPAPGPATQTPPGAGFGRPGGPAAGYGPPEAPPTGLPPAGGYATRFGLVRPNQGRFFAGVCAALGRATNTDPVLWRVLLPVLTLLGGLGVLLYILGMILIPAEGDSGSPVEALAGRGRSSTPRGVTIVLSIIAAVSIIVGISHFGTSLLIAVAVIGGIAFLVTSRSGPANGWQPTWPTMTRTGSGFTVDWPKQNSPAGAHTGTGTGWGPADGVGAPSAGPTDAPATATMAASHTAVPVAEPIDTPGWSPTPGPSTDEGAEVLAAAAKYETGWPIMDTSPDEPTYQAPFAPHGPYAPTSPYSSSFPGLAPTTVVTPPPPPQPPKPHSPTRRITLSAALLVVGFLAILDVAGVASVPAPMYFAAALATIGIGMFIASFFGRVRGPITIGVLLVIGLLLSAVVSGLPHPFTSHTTRITPTSFADVPGGYQDNYGDVRLDLSKVKFTDADHKNIKIRLTFGQITVVLPPDVDVTVIAHAGAGDLDVLGQQHSGVNKDSYTITDDGRDGPGGGTLTIDASVRAGEVEVIR